MAGTLSDYQFMRRHTGSSKRAEKAKEAWGASLNSLQDVYRVFTKYTSGWHLAHPWSLYCVRILVSELCSTMQSNMNGCCKVPGDDMQQCLSAFLALYHETADQG